MNFRIWGGLIGKWENEKKKKKKIQGGGCPVSGGGCPKLEGGGGGKATQKYKIHAFGSVLTR